MDQTKKIISFDIDGTLAQHTGAESSDKIGDPLPYLKVFLNDLIDHQAELIIVSPRQKDTIEAWLKEHGLSYYFKEIHQKPSTFIHLDARTLQFKGSYATSLTEITLFKPWWVGEDN